MQVCAVVRLAGWEQNAMRVSSFIPHLTANCNTTEPFSLQTSTKVQTLGALVPAELYVYFIR